MGACLLDKSQAMLFSVIYKLSMLSDVIFMMLKVTVMVVLFLHLHAGVHCFKINMISCNGSYIVTENSFLFS